MTATETIQKMICDECNVANTETCHKCDINKALGILKRVEKMEYKVYYRDGTDDYDLGYNDCLEKVKGDI